MDGLTDYYTHTPATKPVVDPEDAVRPADGHRHKRRPGLRSQPRGSQCKWTLPKPGGPSSFGEHCDDPTTSQMGECLPYHLDLSRTSPHGYDLKRSQSEIEERVVSKQVGQCKKSHPAPEHRSHDRRIEEREVIGGNDKGWSRKTARRVDGEPPRQATDYAYGRRCDQPGGAADPSDPRLVTRFVIHTIPPITHTRDGRALR
jgi:hypothetical protein